jgi:phage major head subunit gpT-like protein
MSILNKSSRSDIYFDLALEFMDALETAPKQYELLSMVDRTNKPLKKYKWMEAIAKMVKWKGNRKMVRLKGAGHEIANEDWALGIEVERDDLEDDAEFGQVAERIRDLALLGDEAISDQVILWLKSGFSDTLGLAYDGQYFFDTDHTISADGSGAALSNKGTAQFSGTALDAALQVIAGWTDPKGRKLSVKMTHVAHGPALTATMRTTLILPTLSGGGANPHYQLVIPVMYPEIEGNEWFLIAAGKRARPIITQIRRDPKFASPSTSMEDSTAFHTKNYEFGVDSTFGCGYGPWFLAWGSDGSV